MQKTSRSGRLFIGQKEGLRLTAYQDVAGVWTIGYGHTSSAGYPYVKAGMRISKGEALNILQRDLEKFEARVRKYVKVPLTQHQFDALVSFDLNTGRIHNATLTKKLNRGDYTGAAVEFGKWIKAGGRVISGLKNRRAAEKKLFEEGDYGPIDQMYLPLEDEADTVPVPKAKPVKPQGVLELVLQLIITIAKVFRR